MPGIAELAADVVASVKGHVARAIGPLSKRLDDLETSLSALQLKEGPAGPAGERGSAGEPGATGARGPAGDPGPQGERGADGAPGRDGVDGKEGAAGADGMPGKDGAPGRDGVAGVDGKDGAPGPEGQRGPVGEKGLDGRDGKDGRDGRDGKDGAPGRDAADIIAVPEIAPDKSYPQGTFAACYGGMLFAARDTDPLRGGSKPNDLAAAGWRVVLNGIWKESEETEGRTTTRITVYTDGKESVRVTKSAVPEDRGVWREGEYEKGDSVTFGGSVFIAQRDTNDRPETSDSWRLAVKRGRDGRDGGQKK